MNILMQLFTVVRALATKKERGFTLLEYCAGAAVLAAAVYGAMSLFGDSLNTYFTNLADWVTNTAGGSTSGGN